MARIPKQMGRFPLAVILALATLIIWTSFAAWTSEVHARRFKTASHPDRMVFSVEGIPLVEHSSNWPFEFEFLTLDGTKVDKIEQVDSRSLAPTTNSNCRPNWFSRMRMIPANHRTWFVWYLIHDGAPNGLAYFQGFRQDTRESLGYLGKSGHSRTLPLPEDRFRVSTELDMLQIPSFQDMIVVIFGSEEAWEINLNRVEARRRWQGQGAIDFGFVVKARSKQLGAADETDPPELVVRKRDELVFLDKLGEVDHSLALPEAMRKARLQFVVLPSGSHAFIAEQLDEPTRIYWLDKQGVEKTRETDVFSMKSDPTTTASWFGNAAIAPAPIVMIGGIAGHGKEIEESRGISYQDAVAAEFAKAWPALLVVCVGSLALAIFVHRRQTSLDQGAALGWAIFVFLFGVAGLAGYWWHRRWPICAACPRCGKVVPRDRDACLACREEFPAPAALSTEIRS